MNVFIDHCAIILKIPSTSTLVLENYERRILSISIIELPKKTWMINYPKSIRAMKNLVISATFLIFAQSIPGQTVNDTLKSYYNDSLIVHKKFNNGKMSSALTIRVINPCNPVKEKFDGAFTQIEAVLKNQKYSSTVIYNYPEAQSGLINFKEKNISNFKIKNKIAVIIPFSYCGNFDNDTKISYIIFYDHKKYLHHINYRCGENLQCKVNDDLNLKLKDLPLGLRAIFVMQLETKFRHADDF